MNNITWASEKWLEGFNDYNVDYKKMRRDVWSNTKAIVHAGGYTLSDGRHVSILKDGEERRESTFYSEEFRAEFEPLNTPPEITVVSDDCLDAAHKWIREGLDVSVLNMASRRNPGGGVQKGSGAQEEYLFRCSDYFMFMYGFADYAEQYGLKRSKYQYPLDRNFGGIYSPNVCVFRENESTGYRLSESVRHVNMIAVPAMNSPRLVNVKGEERISGDLVGGVKNKIRTIFRIACANAQRNLILGAHGCGAFHNPPEHIAELFRDVLSEQEFSGAFSRICFAVKTDHNSKGGRNYDAFAKVFSDRGGNS